MTTQNYYMVNKDTNICDNVCLWDGNPETWTPPSTYLMLIQATTPTKIWGLNVDKTAFVLVDSINDGSIGWTWDGTYLITNDPQPSPPQPQPVTDLPTV
jgi:hypothetical protein